MYATFILVYMFHQQFYVASYGFKSIKDCQTHKYELFHNPKIDQKRINKAECRRTNKPSKNTWHKL